MSEVVLTKEEKAQRYKKLNESCLKGQIVFAGSSLMEMFPIEKFTEEDNLGITVYNRSIGGYVTQELLDSMMRNGMVIYCLVSFIQIVDSLHFFSVVLRQRIPGDER